MRGKAMAAPVCRRNHLEAAGGDGKNPAANRHEETIRRELAAARQSVQSAPRRRVRAAARRETMPTELLFRQDAYLQEVAATVEAVNERGGIVLDRTVFYATGGGQPGDAGHLRRADGSPIVIGTTIYDPADRSRVVHVPIEGQTLPTAGEAVVAVLDWERRLKRMRIHTALHLLSVVLPFPVTGGSVGDGDGRLDFDIPEGGLDKAEVAEKLNALIARNAGVTESWITDEELDANPGLVKTMSVKPPRGSGRVRLVAIGDIDLQPCGGTHVRNTAEIGAVAVTDIEKKGKQNRRVRIALA
jgi:misacylated tRNA(Ala) deacylase